MANAPQNVTRIMAAGIGAPPALAPSPPKTAKTIREIAAMLATSGQNLTLESGERAG
jgi:hypothetical protein